MAEQRKGGPKPILSQFEEFPDFHRDHIEVIYSLSEWHKVYVEEEDITGYSAAMKLLGDWEEWQRMMNGSAKLAREVDKWNEEIKTRIKSRAFKNIVALTRRDDGVGLSAARWINEEGWYRKKAGRPSKAQVDAEKKRLAKEAQTTKEEADRVMEALQ